jgi:hypothetical protein
MLASCCSVRGSKRLASSCGGKKRHQCKKEI